MVIKRETVKVSSRNTIKSIWWWNTTETNRISLVGGIVHIVVCHVWTWDASNDVMKMRDGHVYFSWSSFPLIYDPHKHHPYRPDREYCCEEFSVYQPSLSSLSEDNKSHRRSVRLDCTRLSVPDPTTYKMRSEVELFYHTLTTSSGYHMGSSYRSALHLSHCCP